MNKILYHKILFFLFILFCSIKLKPKLINHSINKILNIDNFINYDIFNQTQRININNINKLLKEKSKIKNIFIIIILLPFLKSNKLIIKNFNKALNKLFKNIFINNQNNTFIKLNEKYFNYLTLNLKDLLYYKWDLIPEFNLIQIVRYIINNYYNEFNLEIFDKSLNLNFKHFINNNYNNLSIIDINNLMSKIYFFSFLCRK